MLKIYLILVCSLFLAGCETPKSNSVDIPTEQRINAAEEALVTPCGAGICGEK